MSEAQGPAFDPVEAPTSTPYRRYALTLLTITYAFSMLDRQIVTILAEAVKTDLHLADWKLGAMTGLAFALFYTFLGIPIARWADRGDRSRIISAALALWSAFTILCGLARTFPMLLLARMGVGVGEAGGMPPAHSLITEMTPRARRASALAGYSLGLPLGSLVGLTFGGLVADAFGWRAAFLLAGAPGLVLAAITWRTLREPRRDPTHANFSQGGVPFGEVLRELRFKTSFRWVALGAAFSGFGYYGQTAFLGSLLLRGHRDEVRAMAQAVGLGPGGLVGILLGVTIGWCSAAGMFLGGRLADRTGGKDIRAYVSTAAWALVAACPFMTALALAPGVGLMLGALALGVALQSIINGPLFATVQTLVRPRARATSAAVMVFVINLIGLGFGPLLTGLLSDALAGSVGPAAAVHWAVAAAGLIQAPAAGCLFLALPTVRDDEFEAIERSASHPISEFKTETSMYLNQ